MADQGELGPLDIQVQKPDEIFQRSSGLDIIRGLTYLYDGVLNTFRDYLIDINGGSGLSTKAASEIASKITIGIHEPIFAQIDPLRLGEMQAALTIALDYGQRLDARTKNLKPNALQMLTSGYPSHGFVIDRKEARQLFNKVRCPIDVEQILANWIRGMFAKEAGLSPLVINCIDEFSKCAEKSSSQSQCKPTDVQETSEDNNAKFKTEPSSTGHNSGSDEAFGGVAENDEILKKSSDGSDEEHRQTGS